MNQNKIITYSVLAYINNKDGNSINVLDIFVPLFKRLLHKFCKEGITKGENISEIKYRADREYGLDFPIPTVKIILKRIADEINTQEKKDFCIYQNGGFEINKYIFEDYEDIITQKENDIDKLQELFNEFKSEFTNRDTSENSIFDFIEKNKINLSIYLSSSNEIENRNDKNYTIEAQFIDYFKGTIFFDTIKDIYIGSILSCYIEYIPNNIQKDVELVLDTNFIVGLLDLNTEESTHTCRTLLKIANKIGFSISVLEITIDETQKLLNSKAESFGQQFLQGKINREDVFNACDRRNLNKTDLENISYNIKNILKEEYGIHIFKKEFNLSELRQTEQYKKFKQIRQTDFSAIHDATVIEYVKRKRNGNIKKFEDVKCWFVHNAFSQTSFSLENKKKQPEAIKADDLLNRLWLSIPSINREISSEDIAIIGLSSSISLTLNKDLPKIRVIKELEDNIQKYSKEDISEEEIIRLGQSIVDKQLTEDDVLELNELAKKEDKREFSNKIKDIARKKEEQEKFLFDKLNGLMQTAKNIIYEGTEKGQENIDLKQKNKNLIETIENMKINNKLSHRRRVSIGLLLGLIFLTIIIFYFSNNENWKETLISIKDFWWLIGLILSLPIKFFYDTHFSESYIRNFKENKKTNEKL